ncbi:MAG: hypothetical protein J07HX5_02137, partial [halophilic archaeon J07HX5]
TIEPAFAGLLVVGSVLDTDIVSQTVFVVTTTGIAVGGIIGCIFNTAITG